MPRMPPGDAASTVDECLQAIVAANPDADAWRTLRKLAAFSPDGPGVLPEVYLAGLLGAALDRLPEAGRGSILDGVATFLAGESTVVPLAAALASDASPAGHELALALMARLRPPLDPSLHGVSAALLLDRRLPPERQFGAVANLLRSFPTEDPRAADTLNLLVSGLGKSRSIERLHQLERLTGPHRALSALLAKLEDQLRMCCPRCGAEHRRPEMIEHLWREHQLVLEGRRVREPWSVVEDFVEAAIARRDPQLIEQGRALAGRLDPTGGPSRVLRMMLRRDPQSPEARAALLREAVEKHASLCPNCFYIHRLPPDLKVPPMTVSHGRLASNGYVVEVSETGLLTHLEVATPRGVVFKGREPRPHLTPNGLKLLVGAPPVWLALILAISAPAAGWLISAVFLSLGLGLTAWLVAHAYEKKKSPAAVRARRYAWTYLVPEILEGDGSDSAAAAFCAALANYCLNYGDSTDREAVLPALLEVAERAMRRGGSPAHLAPLRRLAILDVAGSDDPLPLVADELARCFEGGLPLVAGEHLLAGWDAVWRTPANLARLRILLCDRAFAAGFEVNDLIESTAPFPNVAEVLRTVDRQALAALRLLWSLRPRKPWDRLGPVETAFELATDPDGAELLARRPEVLLWQEDRRWRVVADGGKGRMGPAQIALDARGVILQEVFFNAPPRVVQVRSKMLGSDLLLGTTLFRGPEPLDDLALHMERWFRYAFNDFLPLVDGVLDWRSPDPAVVLRARGAVACPECGRKFLPRAGDFGLSPSDDSADARRTT